MGKLITFEGTDCSGKETQTDLIVEKLRKKDIRLQNLHYHTTHLQPVKLSPAHILENLEKLISKKAQQMLILMPFLFIIQLTGFTTENLLKKLLKTMTSSS